MSFTDKALLNQSLFRQINERKIYIILLKFRSVKHKACHLITKSPSHRLLPQSHAAGHKGREHHLTRCLVKQITYFWSIVKIVMFVTSSAFSQVAQLKTQVVLWVASEESVSFWVNKNLGWVQPGWGVMDWWPWTEIRHWCCAWQMEKSQII